MNRRTLFTLAPKTDGNNHHIFYLHGGGYIAGISSAHWYFLDQLINKLNCSVSMYDYTLAPKQHARQTLNDVLAAYQTTIESNSSRITVMGDSAGGGLSLAIGQMTRDSGIKQPGRIIALSPWMDLSMQNPDIMAIEDDDFFLDKKTLIAAGKAYVGSGDLANPLHSPVYANFRNLPSIHFFMGTHDILMPDTRLAVENAREQGVHIDYREYEELFHVWMLFPIPEAKKVLTEIKEIMSLD
ncbi:MAG: alpha/beta hydrolase [Calditrichota bacterium]